MKTIHKAFDSVADGLKYVEEALMANPRSPSAPTKGLPLKAIIVCETVFQRRDVRGNRHGRDEHVRDLKRAIQDDPGQMEPVAVWWGGEGWFLLDGHHRVLAYESLKFFGNIPVKVVEGSLGDALAHVGTANTRNKLMMTKDERMNLAVFYVCVFPDKSLRQLGHISGVGKSQIGTIKKAVEQVMVAMGQSREELMDLSWYELREIAQGEATSDYDYEGEMLKTVHEIRQALGPILGRKPHRHVEALAIALGQISPALYRGLMDWGSHIDEPDDDDLEVVDY